MPSNDCSFLWSIVLPVCPDKTLFRWFLHQSRTAPRIQQPTLNTGLWEKDVRYSFLRVSPSLDSPTLYFQYLCIADMARTPHTPRRSKRLRNRRRPIHSIASVQRQSLRVAIRQSLEQHQPVGAVAGSSGSSIDSRESSPLCASSSSEEDSSITDTESQKSPSRSPGQFNGVPDKKPGWYKIKRIVAQRLNYYLVEWEGVDPDTGLDWPLDFVSDHLDAESGHAEPRRAMPSS